MAGLSICKVILSSPVSVHVRASSSETNSYTAPVLQSYSLPENVSTAFSPEAKFFFTFSVPLVSLSAFMISYSVLFHASAMGLPSTLQSMLSRDRLALAVPAGKTLSMSFTLTSGRMSVGVSVRSGSYSQGERLAFTFCAVGDAGVIHLRVHDRLNGLN